MSDEVSAEQLAIALMSQARSFYDQDLLEQQRGTVDWKTYGDRLADWASQARQIGVTHYGERLNLEAQKAHLRKGLEEAQAKIDDVRGRLRSVKDSSDPVLWADTLEAIAVMLGV